MELPHFLIFCKDGRTRYSDDKLREIYDTTCEQNLRQRLTCDDFVEAIKKYKLITSKKILEDQRKMREERMQDIKDRLKSNRSK